VKTAIFVQLPKRPCELGNLHKKSRCFATLQYRGVDFVATITAIVPQNRLDYGVTRFMMMMPYLPSLPACTALLARVFQRAAFNT
jgi:hypothetical protein